MASIDMKKALIREKNMVVGDNYRISVLTERLLRLEYNPDKVFYSNPTQLALFRDFDEVAFELKQDERYLEITTSYFRLSYAKEKNFDGGKFVPSSNLRVELLNTDQSWYYKSPEAKNYGGVFSSADGDLKNQSINKGLYSISGFASIDDSESMIFREDGILVDKEHKGIDIYLFMYNKDFDLALQDYFKLTGYPNLIPRYAFGNWWSRDIDYNEEELLNTIANFERNEIPLSVFLLNKSWHNINKKGDEDVESGFTFNKTLIPNPNELIEKLHEKNIRIALNINPEDGIYPSEEAYSTFSSKYNVTDNKIISFNTKNIPLVKEFIKDFVIPLKDMEIDFFWNDYNKKSSNINGLWTLNHYLLNDIYQNNDIRELLLSRNSVVASHRYPIHYVGQENISWETLRKIPFVNQMASNIGVSYLSHDVGGYYGGIEDEDLYIRYVQLAVYLPILRFNAPRGRYYRREPWRWNVKTLKIVGDYLRFRHKLIPYIYTESYKYHKEGKVLIKPLYYKYPWVYDDSNYKNQYFFGDSLLVAPITSKQDELMKRTVHKFFIPEGVWYDLKTGKKFPGNKEYVSFFKMEDYPVFVSSGSIIPMSRNSGINNINNPTTLEIEVFPGKSNTYNLYEDDGVTNLYKDNYYLLTQIDYNYLPSNYTLIIRSLEGKSGIVPDFRDYRIVFRNTKKASSVIAYYNEGVVPTTSYFDNNNFIVEIKQVPTIGQLTINCKGKDIEIDAVRLINDDIDSILLDLQISTVLKEKISLIMFSDLPIKRKRIEIRKLKKFGLTGPYLKLFLKLLEYISNI